MKRKKRDYDLLYGRSAVSMDYATWRNAPKYHSKELKERFKMNSKIRNIILQKYNYTCNSCGSKTNLQIDHIIPISRGGKTILKNLQVLCKKCNQKKHNKTMEEFNKWRIQHGKT